MDGVSKLAAVMHGAGFTAQTMTKTAGVGSSVLQVSGVRHLTHQIMASKFGALSITALQERPFKSRLLK
jgi:hypothetical protein